MEDQAILALYWERNADAIRETAAKYGGYCGTVARNILGSREDAEECVNDVYLRAWGSIPPQRPKALSAYLGKLTRNLAFDRYRQGRAKKRGGGELALVLAELEDCVSGRDSVDRTVETRELVAAIDDFLTTLPPEKCSLFLGRYWYAAPVAELARRFSMTPGNVSVSLSRLRDKLKQYLTERGFDL